METVNAGEDGNANNPDLIIILFTGLEFSYCVPETFYVRKNVLKKEIRNNHWKVWRQRMDAHETLASGCRPAEEEAESREQRQPGKHCSGLAADHNSGTAPLTVVLQSPLSRIPWTDESRKGSGFNALLQSTVSPSVTKYYMDFL